jgi:two-component system, cell cycle sensor histidine kinase and response regulator CckA
MEATPKKVLDEMPAKRALKRKDKNFQFLFEENPQPMWLFDPVAQTVLQANAAASKLYGYSREEFCGLSLARIESSESAERLSAKDTNTHLHQVTCHRHKTNGGALIEVETTRRDIEYNGAAAQLVMLDDMTLYRQLEDQLRQAQKMEAVGMLAGGVAHDFNNLLTIITGYGQLILNTLGPADPNRHSAEQILKAGERAATLTRQLLAFSRRQVLQPKILDLNKLVSSLSTMLRRLIGEDIDLQQILRPELGQVSADPGQMEQVLMNLVVNARDAMPGGGTLTIETANVSLDQSYVSRHLAVKPGPYTMMAVSDTGTGMDQDTLAHLFEPFFTTNSSGQGTGFGLSTVFGIVKQSRGSVDVYSVPAHGTSVKVYLPRIDQPVTVESEALQKAATGGSETILVVEDDEMVRNLVSETLKREGYRVLDAAEPLEARRISASHKSVIHLLITDVVMPKVSGRDLAVELSRQRLDMKVLYMSGYTDSAIVNSGILQKEVAFLQKPFTPGALAEKVREVLEGSGNGKTRRAGK